MFDLRLNGTIAWSALRDITNAIGVPEITPLDLIRVGFPRTVSTSEGLDYDQLCSLFTNAQFLKQHNYVYNHHDGDYNIRVLETAIALRILDRMSVDDLRSARQAFYYEEALVIASSVQDPTDSTHAAMIAALKRSGGPTGVSSFSANIHSVEGGGSRTNPAMQNGLPLERDLLIRTLSWAGKMMSPTMASHLISVIVPEIPQRLQLHEFLVLASAASDRKEASKQLQHHTIVGHAERKSARAIRRSGSSQDHSRNIRGSSSRTLNAHSNTGRASGDGSSSAEPPHRDVNYGLSEPEVRLYDSDRCLYNVVDASALVTTDVQMLVHLDEEYGKRLPINRVPLLARRYRHLFRTIGPSMTPLSPGPAGVPHNQYRLHSAAAPGSDQVHHPSEPNGPDSSNQFDNAVPSVPGRSRTPVKIRFMRDSLEHSLERSSKPARGIGSSSSAGVHSEPLWVYDPNAGAFTMVEQAPEPGSHHDREDVDDSNHFRRSRSAQRGGSAAMTGEAGHATSSPFASGHAVFGEQLQALQQRDMIEKQGLSNDAVNSFLPKRRMSLRWGDETSPTHSRTQTVSSSFSSSSSSSFSGNQQQHQHQQFDGGNRDGSAGLSSSLGILPMSSSAQYNLTAHGAHNTFSKGGASRSSSPTQRGNAAHPTPGVGGGPFGGQMEISSPTSLRGSLSHGPFAGMGNHSNVMSSISSNSSAGSGNSIAPGAGRRASNPLISIPGNGSSTLGGRRQSQVAIANGNGMSLLSSTGSMIFDRSRSRNSNLDDDAFGVVEPISAADANAEVFAAINQVCTNMDMSVSQLRAREPVTHMINRSRLSDMVSNSFAWDDMTPFSLICKWLMFCEDISAQQQVSSNNGTTSTGGGSSARGGPASAGSGSDSDAPGSHSGRRMSASSIGNQSGDELESLSSGLRHSSSSRLLNRSGSSSRGGMSTSAASSSNRRQSVDAGLHVGSNAAIIAEAQERLDALMETGPKAAAAMSQLRRSAAVHASVNFHRSLNDSRRQLLGARPTSAASASSRPTSAATSSRPASSQRLRSQPSRSPSPNDTSRNSGRQGGAHHASNRRPQSAFALSDGGGQPSTIYEYPTEKVRPSSSPVRRPFSAAIGKSSGVLIDRKSLFGLSSSPTRQSQQQDQHPAYERDKRDSNHRAFGRPQSAAPLVPYAREFSGDETRMIPNSVTAPRPRSAYPSPPKRPNFVRPTTSPHRSISAVPRSSSSGNPPQHVGTAGVAGRSTSHVVSRLRLDLSRVASSELAVNPDDDFSPNGNGSGETRHLNADDSGDLQLSALDGGDEYADVPVDWDDDDEAMAAGMDGVQRAFRHRKVLGARDDFAGGPFRDDGGGEFDEGRSRVADNDPDDFTDGETDGGPRTVGSGTSIQPSAVSSSTSKTVNRTFKSYGDMDFTILNRFNIPGRSEMAMQRQANRWSSRPRSAVVKDNTFSEYALDLLRNVKINSDHSHRPGHFMNQQFRLPR